MNSKKEIGLEKEGLEGLKNLVEVYQEVAATRMQRVRSAVLQSRLFTEGLEDVFARVRNAYKQLKDKPKSLRLLNGRTVAVLVSANSGLYGDVIEKTFEEFSNFVRNRKPDVVVLGKLGVKQMTDKLPTVFYNYFDVPDELIDMKSFDMVMRYLLQFERIIVFHGQFQSILTQVVKQTLVSGSSVEEPGAKINEERGVDYLFEPSVEAIAKIFEGEIMGSIFEQALHESMLAKQASRMQSLDRSLDNIDKRLDKVAILQRLANHRLVNRKQLATISGVSLWS